MIRFFIMMLCFLFLAVSAKADVYYWEQWQSVKERQPLEWHMGREFTDKDVFEVFNSIYLPPNYKSDYTLYGKEEYWATPIEFKSKGNGDCEDVAIARAYELARRGVGRLQLYVGKQGVVPHMMLVVNDKWVLDARAKEPVLLNEFKGFVIEDKLEVL